MANDSNSELASVFQPIYEWSASRIVGLIIYALTETVGNLLLVGIIWYEKCGSDPSMRTLINKLTSAFCLMLLVLNLSLTNLVAYTHLYGPQSSAVCSVMIFGSNFFLCLGLLYLDTIIILRYMYIFRWKNVGAINDRAFSLFSTINNIVIAFLICFILYIMGFNQNINYFICLGQDPRTAKDLGLNPLQMAPVYSYDIFCLLPALSYVIHLFIFLRIYFYNRAENSKRKAQFNIIGSTDQNRNISDLCTSMLSMCLIFSSSIPMVLLMAFFTPEDLGMGPGRLCVYLAHFGIQFMTSIPLTLSYYTRNDGLRQAVLKKFEGLFRFMKCAHQRMELGEKLRLGMQVLDHSQTQREEHEEIALEPL